MSNTEIDYLVGTNAFKVKECDIRHNDKILYKNGL